jgi:hypothetical protein
MYQHQVTTKILMHVLDHQWVLLPIDRHWSFFVLGKKLNLKPDTVMLCHS